MYFAFFVLAIFILVVVVMPKMSKKNSEQSFTLDKNSVWYRIEKTLALCWWVLGVITTPALIFGGMASDSGTQQSLTISSLLILLPFMFVFSALVTQAALKSENRIVSYISNFVVVAYVSTLFYYLSLW